MVDIHCHPFPALDDGPTSLEDTLTMLSIAKDEGIRVIAATHHFDEEQMTVNQYLAVWDEKYKIVKKAAELHNLDINFVKGAEVRISPYLAQLEGLKHLCIHDSRYLLIELPTLDIPTYTEDVIYSLRLKGIIPIIAHPERNLHIVKDPNRLLPLIELGALGQITSGSITGLFGAKIKRCARMLLEHNMVHVVASDAHSPRSRSPRMKQAARQVGKWVGEKESRLLVEHNPQAVLDNVVFDVEGPIPHKKSIFSLH